MRVLVSLAFRRLWHQRGRWGLLAVGVALVVAIPVTTAALARSVDARAVRRTIAALSTSDRELTVSQETDSVQRRGTSASNNADVRRQLSQLSALPVVRELAFRPLVVAGSSMTLGGVDELGRWTRLTSGRAPATCTPTRCEVLVVGGGDTAALRKAAIQIGVAVVGVAAARTPALANGAGAQPGTPLLLAASADEIARLSALALFSRHLVWTGAVDADRVVALGVHRWVARAAAVSAVLADRDAATIDAPTYQLQAIEFRADASGRRLALLGGFAAVLLLGFAVVAAVGLRRDGLLLNEVLRRRGATAGRTAAATAVQTAAACAVGAVVGFMLGGGLAAAISRGTGLTGLGVALHAVGAALVPAALLTLATAAVGVAVLLWPQAQARTVGRVLDLTVLVCVGAAVLAGARGSASAAELTGQADPLIPALPALSCVAAGLVAARLWAPAMQLAEHLLPRRSLAGRIALVGAIRRPLRPVATTAFLTAAIASVVFAGAYRSTLLANDADQAAFRVPLDRTVAPGLGLPAPTSVPGAGKGVDVYPVLRTAAEVTRLAGVVDSVPVVAVDAAALPRMARWSRTTGAAATAADVAQQLLRPLPALPRLPAGARVLAIDASGADPQTSIALWVRAADGQLATGGQRAGAEQRVDLRVRGSTLIGRLPDLGAGPLSVTAFGVAEGGDYATHHEHAVNEGNSDQPLLSGRLRLGTVRTDGRPAPWSWASWGSAGGAATATSRELRFAYRLSGTTAVAAPDFAAEQATELPVVVDPATALDAHGGELELQLDSETLIRARVVMTMPRLPTTSGAFILADRAVFQRLVDLHEPGRNATEFWVAGSSAALAAALTHSGLAVTSRAAVQSRLDADPIGKGARLLLALVALLALAVAAVALMLTVVGERRDGAGELYAWEADGVRPRMLRRVLAVRALTVVAVAAPIGVTAGLVLARIGTRLVAVDASGTSPRPALEVSLGSAWSVVALVAGVGAGLLAGWAVATVALRERHPVAAEVELR